MSRVLTSKIRVSYWKWPQTLQSGQIRAPVPRLRTRGNDLSRGTRKTAWQSAPIIAPPPSTTTTTTPSWIPMQLVSFIWTPSKQDPNPVPLYHSISVISLTCSCLFLLPLLHLSIEPFTNLNPIQSDFVDLWPTKPSFKKEIYYRPAYHLHQHLMKYIFTCHIAIISLKALVLPTDGFLCFATFYFEAILYHTRPYRCPYNFAAAAQCFKHCVLFFPGADMPSIGRVLLTPPPP